MKWPQVVLSIFPGMDVLGMGFRAEGFYIVWGPDRLWGWDVRDFHVPPGLFDGVIGGPPCQVFSRVRHVNPLAGRDTGNLIPEFERVVFQAQPPWWLMENVRDAPLPNVPGYQVEATLINNRWWGHEQNREHRFSFGTREGLKLRFDDVVVFESPTREPRVCASDCRRTPIKLLAGKKLRKGSLNLRPKRSLQEMLRLQGLPADVFEHSPFTREAQIGMLGNAVPLTMARSLARAVKGALERS